MNDNDVSKTKTPTQAAADPPEAAVTLNSRETVDDNIPTSTTDRDDTNTGTAAIATTNDGGTNPTARHLLSEESPCKQQTDKLQDYQFATTGTTPNAYQQKPAAKRLSIRPAPQKQESDDEGEPNAEDVRPSNLERDAAVVYAPRNQQQELHDTGPTEDVSFELAYIVCLPLFRDGIGFTVKGNKIDLISMSALHHDRLRHGDEIVSVGEVEIASTIGTVDCTSILTSAVEQVLFDTFVSKSTEERVIYITFKRNKVKTFQVTTDNRSNDAINHDFSQVPFTKPLTNYHKGVYVSVSDITDKEREEISKASAGLPQISHWVNYSHIGQTGNAKKRNSNRLTETDGMEYDTLMIEADDMERLELYWLFVMTKAGKRRHHRDVFHLTADDMLLMREASAYLKANNILRVKVEDTWTVEEERSNLEPGSDIISIDYHHFHNTKLFEEWYAKYGYGPQKKPKKSNDELVMKQAVGNGLFNVNFAKLCEFRDENSRDPTPKRDGKIGQWCQSKRSTKACRQIFDEWGFSVAGNKERRVNKYIQQITEFRVAFDRLPGNTVGSSDYEVYLANKLQYLRSHKKVSKEHKEEARKLGLIGVGIGTSNHDKAWNTRYQELIMFLACNKVWPVYREHGEPDPKETTLARWCSSQRRRLDKGEMKDDEREKLKELNFIWDKEEQAWNEALAELKRYKEKHGDCMVNTVQSTIRIGNSTRNLGQWVKRQRKEYKKYDNGEKNNLTEDRINKLNDIGFDFSPPVGGSKGKKERKASNSNKNAASKNRKASNNNSNKKAASKKRKASSNNKSDKKKKARRAK